MTDDGTSESFTPPTAAFELGVTPHIHAGLLTGTAPAAVHRRLRELKVTLRCDVLFELLEHLYDLGLRIGRVAELHPAVEYRQARSRIVRDCVVTPLQNLNIRRLQRRVRAAGGRGCPILLQRPDDARGRGGGSWIHLPLVVHESIAGGERHQKGKEEEGP